MWSKPTFSLLSSVISLVNERPDPDLNIAPPESEEKLAVLRVVRMMEDKSGRNNEAVKQYMARRWSNEFHGQRDIQAQLMVHLDYALEHTDWHAQRQSSDSDAVSRWTPMINRSLMRSRN